MPNDIDSFYVQLCSIHFVMAICEVATRVPKVFTPFFEKGVLFFLFFIFCQGFSWRSFRRVGAEEERIERFVFTWKQQFSFICDFLVLEQFGVIIRA